MEGGGGRRRNRGRMEEGGLCAGPGLAGRAGMNATAGGRGHCSYSRAHFLGDNSPLFPGATKRGGQRSCGAGTQGPGEGKDIWEKNAEQ